MREQILDIARRLFIREGYRGLAMHQISDALGVTKAALYYHFKNKEELFMAILESDLDVMSQVLDEIRAEGGSYREQVTRFVAYVLRQPVEQRAIIRLGSQEIGQVSPEARQAFNRHYYAKFTGKIEAILRLGMEAGEFRSLPPSLATHTLLGIIYPYLYNMQASDQAQASQLSDETIRQIVSIYLDGIIQPSEVFKTSEG